LDVHHRPRLSEPEARNLASDRGLCALENLSNPRLRVPKAAKPHQRDPLVILPCLVLPVGCAVQRTTLACSLLCLRDLLVNHAADSGHFLFVAHSLFSPLSMTESMRFTRLSSEERRVGK